MKKEKEKNVYEEIARVAYDLYEKRGKVHGYELNDWVEAERIVMKRHAKEIEHEAEVIKSTKRTKVKEKTVPKKPKSAKKTSR